MTSYYSHGKILLTGEYLVLDGALALALPTRMGQWLEVVPSQAPGLRWTSRSPDGTPWFETHFSQEELGAPPEGGFPSGVRERLLFMLRTARAHAPGFLQEPCSLTVETKLEFPREWGLGSSSTLVSNLANWAGVDPYTLLRESLGGSGYDLAAARHGGPLFYQLRDGHPAVSDAPFAPAFAGQLFFVYLNRKQDSREGIRRYRQRHFDQGKALREVSSLTRQLAGAPDLVSFCRALEQHEALLSDILGVAPVKEAHFPDYPGSLKSLGAWGGDFILATGSEKGPGYFREKGYDTLIPYREMIL
ncbi:GYDIA family GHMP kinase [Robiginitalea marina]|uniref:GYDIA family GHMP kinase n=1 Tax=Robiginitalea marina TaxID=2954105 RepID=A0ABT1B072_9FLAO|nr:GYDIA family GHMP kinase [Robiginitalea marina]MCO5725701.1 GYDIA family GHMP kinase [Robiginitalea marina]